MLIEYSQKRGKTECTAFLLEFKNRTSDLAAEREKAEKKQERELNAAPDSVTALKAFWNYKKLEDGTLMITSYKGIQTDITVPEKIGKSIVTVVGERAFSPTNKRLKTEQTGFLKTIKRVVLPDTVTAVGQGAFAYCGELEYIELPENITVIPEQMFSFCRGLKRVIIPGSVRKIDPFAFNECNALEEIMIPEGVVEINEKAFRKCSSLKNIRLPGGLQNIPQGMFYGCEKLTAVTIPGCVKSIGGFAFCECGELSVIAIPDSVTEIGYSAFANCKKLKTAAIPASVEHIKCAVEYLNGLPKNGGIPTIFEGSENAAALVEPGSYAEEHCREYNIPYTYKK